MLELIAISIEYCIILIEIYLYKGVITMHAKIYLPAKTATQSGIANTKHWILEFDQDNTSYKSTLMLWNGSKETTKQVRLKFTSCQEAIKYAEKHKLNYTVIKNNTTRPKKKSYADNFTSS